MLAAESRPPSSSRPTPRAAARWARRLDAARLDSGAGEASAERPGSRPRGSRARRGGTRGALSRPCAAHHAGPARGARPAHKPPGPPRLHRATSSCGAPPSTAAASSSFGGASVESWARVDEGAVWSLPRRRRPPGPRSSRPTRAHPAATIPLPCLSPGDRGDVPGEPRRRAIVGRATGVLGCNDCGALLSCPDCGCRSRSARDRRALVCRLWRRVEPLPIGVRRAGAGGSPVRLGSERVEALGARRFPRLTSPASDPGAQVVIGNRPCCAGAAPADGGAVDSSGWMASCASGLSRERACLPALWAAAEAVGGSGRVIARRFTRSLCARRGQEPRARSLYRQELGFRAELGYPPLQRLCHVSARGKTAATGRALLEEAAAAIAGVAGLTIYPLAALGAPRSRVGRALALRDPGPRRAAPAHRPALRPFLERGRRSGVW